MPAQLKIEEALVYKNIAASFKGMNTNRFPDIINYLERYVNDNENNQGDEEKQKKVAAARILMQAFTQNGRLKEIVDSMQQDTDTQIDQIIEKNDWNVFLGLDELKKENVFKSLQYLGHLNAGENQEENQNISIEKLDEALDTFLVSDNFQEYEASDSPVRSAIPMIKAAADAYRAIRVLENNANRREYNRDIAEPVRSEWGKIKRDEAKTFYVIYGTEHMSLKETETDVAGVYAQAEKIETDILEAERNCQNALLRELEANKTLEGLDAQIRRLESELEQEKEAAKRPERVREARNREDAVKNAIKVVLDAYDEAVKSPDKNFLIRAKEDQEAHVKAQTNLKTVRAQANVDQRIDELMKQYNVSPEKKQKLMDLYQSEYKWYQEENKWRQFKSNIEQYQLVFGQDNTMMLFMVGTMIKDKKLTSEGFQAIEKTYDAVSAEFGLAGKTTTEVDTFLEEGKRGLLPPYQGDVDQYMKDVLETVSKNAELARHKSAENTLKGLLISIQFDDRQLISLQKELVKAGDNKEKIQQLAEKVSKITTHRGEYQNKLLSEGFKDEQLLKDVIALAQKQATTNQKEILDNATRKEKHTKIDAEESIEKHKKIQAAVMVLNEYPEITKAGEYGNFVKYLESSKPDGKLIPKNKKDIFPGYKKLLESLGSGNTEKIKMLEEKLAKVKKEKKKAEETIKASQSEASFKNYIGLLEKKEILNRDLEYYRGKAGRLNRIVQNTNSKMRAVYDKMYQDKENIPPRNTDTIYEAIYDQIEAFRKDYNKCLRDDYKADPDAKNSPEYKAIQTALAEFGASREAFREFSDDEIKQKLEALKNASDHYAHEKRGQWFHFIPSAQRKWRLDYADKITAFCNRQTTVTSNLMRMKGEQNISESFEERYNEEKAKDPKNVIDENKEMNKDEKIRAYDVVLNHVFSDQEMQVEYKQKAKEIEEEINQYMKSMVDDKIDAESTADDFCTVILSLMRCDELKKEIRNPAIDQGKTIDEHLETMKQKTRPDSLEKDISDYVKKATEETKEDIKKSVEDLLKKENLSEKKPDEILKRVKSAILIHKEKEKMQNTVKQMYKAKSLQEQKDAVIKIVDLSEDRKEIIVKAKKKPSKPKPELGKGL